MTKFKVFWLIGCQNQWLWGAFILLRDRATSWMVMGCRESVGCKWLLFGRGVTESVLADVALAAIKWQDMSVKWLFKVLIIWCGIVSSLPKMRVKID